MTVRGAALCAVVILGSSLTGCAPVQRPRDARRPVTANPSAIVATELAFARAAREQGQWTAFRRFATKDAEMFVPERVSAQAWLKGRADPPQPVVWTPARVVMACDGSAGATTGPWTRPDGSVGYFTTIWLRQGDGSYKWVLDHGDTLPTPRPGSEFVDSRVAICTGRPGANLTAPAVGEDMKVGLSKDQTLQWRSTVRQDGGREVVVSLWNGIALEPVITDRVAPPGP